MNRIISGDETFYTSPKHFYQLYIMLMLCPKPHKVSRGKKSFVNNLCTLSLYGDVRNPNLTDVIFFYLHITVIVRNLFSL